MKVAVAVSYQNKNTKRETFDPALRVDVVRSRELSGPVLFLQLRKQRLCNVEQTHTVFPYFVEEKATASLRSLR